LRSPLCTYTTLFRSETGGAAIERAGNFVLPTIVTGLSNDAEVVQTETFAPILYVMKYKDLDDAIHMQNDVPQGLSSAIFTNNLKAAEKFLAASGSDCRSEEHTSELQSRENLVCRLLLEKKN